MVRQHSIEIFKLYALMVCLIFLFAACGQQDSLPLRRTPPAPTGSISENRVEVQVSGAISTPENKSIEGASATDFLRINGEKMLVGDKNSGLTLNLDPKSNESYRKQLEELESDDAVGDIASVNCSDEKLQAMNDSSLLSLEEYNIQRYDQLSANERIKTFSRPIRADVLVVCGDIEIDGPVQLVAGNIIFDNANIKISKHQSGNLIVAKELTLVGESSLNLSFGSAEKADRNVFHVETRPNYYKWQGKHLLEDETNHASLNLKTITPQLASQ